MQDHRIVGGRFIVRSLFQVDRIWYGRVRDLETGRIRKISTRERNRRRAEDFLTDWCERRIARDEAGRTEPRRLRAAFEEWIGLKQARPSYRLDLETALRGVYLPALGDAVVSDVGLREIERLLADLAARGRAARTRRKHLSILRGFFRWAVRRKYALEDPTEGIRIPAGPRREGVALSPRQARVLVRSCGERQVVTMADWRRRWTQRVGAGEYLLLAVLIALHTGLRRGNVLGLRWRHVDLGKRRISLKAAEMKSKRAHVVPVHPELAEVLRAVLRRQKPGPDDPVIGRAMHEVRGGFKAAVRRADLPPMRFHDLRHTFSTWLATRAPFAVHQRLMGHSTARSREAEVTLGYTHVPWQELELAIAKMPRLMKKSKKEVDRKTKSV